jgi:predicted RNase H-like nuclease
VARDISLGQAVPLPDPPERDAFGLPVVIWAPAPRPPS